MLPEIRTSGDIYSIPEFDLDRNDVEGFQDILEGFHSEFRDCFAREEGRNNFFYYTIGQFSQMERKSIEPMALNVEGAKVRAIQRFISEATWDDEKMMHIYRCMVNDDMGDENGVLIIDESGFKKKGNDSAGVYKQYCGNIGKVDNCQVGVFAAYASPHGYALLDKELFVPEIWFADEYKKRREKCKFPADLSFETKPQIAARMVENIIEQNIIPAKYVVADSIYGNSPDFVEQLEKHTGKTYFLGVSSETRCWLRMPATIEKEYKYRGKIRQKQVLKPGEKKSIALKDFARSVNDFFWYRRKVSEGTKGPIEYEFSKRRVVLAKNGLPTKEVWLVMKKTIGPSPSYSFFVSNAPVSSRLGLFVWLSGVRWPIEQCFEEGKSELGMDHYEVRKYLGWNHHMLISMLSHFFLWHLKIKLGKKSTSGYYCPA
ncbi:MAG: IS701 family transposase [Deltaproteobacteria bacterium]|jgi:SRSO17 transposase|nr:IS701 family transposase [Deltaproteobacteria bacterium]